MTKLSIAERMRIAALSAERSRRAALSQALASPLLRWTFGAFGSNQLLIVPQDLRTTDPSFWHEVKLGQFGLAGTIAELDGHSPFEIRPPSPAWERALHSFIWLRHLDVVERPEARDIARDIALDWAARSHSSASPAFEPTVMARRLISWISHANLLLDQADARTYDKLSESLGSQLNRLAATWRDARPGYPRLLALISLTLAELSIEGYDRQLAGIGKELAAELENQILEDGGHVSRNPQVLVELMLDLLPLRKCYASRDKEPPAALSSAIARIMPMIRFMRMGDGLLARFNGVGVASPAAQATVLAYDDDPAAVVERAHASNYARLERGQTILIADTGAPPTLEFAAEAHAGALSFELSAGTRMIFVNGGAPAPADVDWRPASRATASHNTVCLAEKSSSRMIRHKGLEELLGGPPIRLPQIVKWAIAEQDSAIELDASHDGYASRFGLVHRRRLLLISSGDALVGLDNLDRLDKVGGPKPKDTPFAIHFHLHPCVVCRRTDKPDVIDIVLDNGETWRFVGEGASLGIEESVHFANSCGPRRALQIVLHGIARPDAQVRWTVIRTA